VTQARVRAEALAFPAERVASLDDLKAWPLLRSVLFETLRLYPAAPLIARSAVEADEVLGCAVAPGCMVTISPWLIHRHRKLWDAPTAFRPERFIDQPHPWGIEAFIPFGMPDRASASAPASPWPRPRSSWPACWRASGSAMASDRPVLPKASITLGPDHEPDFTLAADLIVQARP
jgi:hypothetical protein